MMFGYLFPTKELLSLAERKIFRDYFCTLCFAHRYRYGELSRLMNNFDITFFAIVLNKYGERIEECGDCCKRVKQRKEKFTDEKWTDMVDFNINLVRKKIEDDLNDQPTLISASKVLLLQEVFTKSKRNNPLLHCTFNKEYSNFQELEKSNPSIDEILDGYETFARNTLAEISGVSLEQMNLYLAINKWIYWIDAVNDFDIDFQKKSYNPYIQKGGEINKTQFLQNRTLYLLDSYNSIHHSIVAAYNRCSYPLSNRIIIENIINCSIPSTTKIILENGSIPRRRRLL